MRKVGEAIRYIFGAILTVLIVNKYGFVGLLISLPVAFAVGVGWAMVKSRWARRGGF